jgi:hypothetical protein
MCQFVVDGCPNEFHATPDRRQRGFSERNRWNFGRLSGTEMLGHRRMACGRQDVTSVVIQVPMEEEAGRPWPCYPGHYVYKIQQHMQITFTALSEHLVRIEEEETAPPRHEKRAGYRAARTSTTL